MRIGNLRITWGKKAAKPLPLQVYQTMGFSGIPDDLESYIENGLLGNSTVYTILAIKSRKFASVPRFAYEVKDSKAFKRFKCLSRDITPKGLYALEKAQNDAMREIEHPVIKLLDKPNKYQSGSAYLEQYSTFKFASGFGASYINTGLNDNGEPLELEVLPSQHINIVPDGTLNGIASFKLVMNKIVDLPAEKVMYWAYPNYNYDSLGSHLYGLSPIKAALKDIGASNAGKTAQENMFKHQGAKGAIYDKTGESNFDQAEQTRARIDEIINNNAEAGKLTFLNGDMGLLQFGMSSGDLELIKALGMTKNELCNIWQVPPVLLSPDYSTYNNIENARKDFVTNSIWPECVSFDGLVNSRIIPKYGKDKTIIVSSDISALPEMQDDMKQMAEIFSSLPVMIPNNILEAFKYDKSNDPNMDKVYVKQGYVTLDEMNAQPSGDLGGIQNELNNAGLNDYDN